jgi:hypothetical protein
MVLEDIKLDNKYLPAVMLPNILKKYNLVHEVTDMGDYYQHTIKTSKPIKEQMYVFTFKMIIDYIDSKSE